MAATEYETIVIPKGTVLFRGLHDTSTLTSDFAGMPNEGSFCLYENFNVFFYPFPFVSASVSSYKYTTIYVTTRDLKLVNLILPSKFNRGNKGPGKGGIVSCDKKPVACNKAGREYDPCVDYTKVPQDVSGMIAIAKADADSLRRKSRTIFKNWVNKYFTTYTDSRGLIGVPEFILHPRMDKTSRTEKIDDFEPWYRANKNDFIYHYLHVMSSNPEALQQLMDTFMSEDGLDLGDENPYHLKVNKKTGFFQIDEFSNNQSELISPTLSTLPVDDMVLKQQNIRTAIPHGTISPTLSTPPVHDMVLTQKNMHETIPSEYLNADTIPYGTNSYSTKAEFNMPAETVDIHGAAQTGLLKHLDDGVAREFISVPLRPVVLHNVYVIGGKKYVFLPTPAGREIEKQATINNDKSFFRPQGFVEKHPINRNISAYEVLSIDGKNVPSEQPATHINGIIKYYAEKAGLLGASRRRTRRRTLRKRPLLKSR